MSKGFVIGLVLFVVGALGLYLYKNTQLSSLKFGGADEVVEQVQFSIIKYNGKIVSTRLIIDGTGRLQSRHHITKERVGVGPFYEEKKTINKIQSSELCRYIVSENGFTHEVVTKDVRLE